MILHVLRYYPTLTETFVHDEVAAAAASGAPVALAAFDAREPSGRPAPAPVYAQPHRAGWLRWAGALVVEALRGGAWRGPHPLRVLWLAALIRRVRPARVHVHFAGEAAEWTLRAARQTGVPYAVTVHAVELFKPRPGLAEVLAGAAWVQTISAYNAELLRTRFGVHARVVRCTVSPAPPTRREPGRVLFVGRHVPKKGLDVLLAALPGVLARVDALEVDVVSDCGPREGVTVHGLLPPAAVQALVARASVFVLPCRLADDGDMDGIPVVLLEALAAAVPVVTTAISGIPEVVDDAVGWLVPPDDARALEDALVAALSDPAEAARRGARGPGRLRERGCVRES